MLDATTRKSTVHCGYVYDVVRKAQATGADTPCSPWQYAAAVRRFSSPSSLMSPPRPKYLCSCQLAGEGSGMQQRSGKTHLVHQYSAMAQTIRNSVRAASTTPM